MKRIVILFLLFIIILLIIVLVSSKVIAVLANDESLIIYIDPGHGGFDGGAVGYSVEKDVVLAISLKLKQYLEKTGFKVLLTRDSDQALANTKKDDIHKRVALINNSKADLFLSIHANSFPAPSIWGAQTFYNPKLEQNRLLANEIQGMIGVLQTANHRLAKSISGKYLIDEVIIPGCLVEVGFLTNEQEGNNLNNSDYQERVALMIYLGILSYYEKEEIT